MMFVPNDRAQLAALHQAAQEAGVEAVDPSVMVSTASVAIRQRRFDNALSILTAALVVDPAHARAWALSGAALEAHGEVDAARRAYEMAIALEPADYASALALAALYAAEPDVDRAGSLLSWIITELDEGELRARAIELKRSLAR